jgi:rhodanese-related sulfurtransferase
MNQITVDQLSALDQPALIDVREADEFAAGHAPGAVNVPLSELHARAQEIPADGDVYLICQAGGRSAQATAFLGARGVNAINVTGGTNAWIRSGHPIAGVTA